MYERLESITLKTSASALDNNLAVRVDVDGGHQKKQSTTEFAVIHKSVVNVVSASSSRINDIRRFGVGGGVASAAAAAVAAAAGDSSSEEDGDTKQQQFLVKDPSAAETTNSNVTQVRQTDRLIDRKIEGQEYLDHVTQLDTGKETDRWIDIE